MKQAVSKRMLLADKMKSMSNIYVFIARLMSVTHNIVILASLVDFLTLNKYFYSLKLELFSRSLFQEGKKHTHIETFHLLKQSEYYLDAR